MKPLREKKKYEYISPSFRDYQELKTQIQIGPQLHPANDYRKSSQDSFFDCITSGKQQGLAVMIRLMCYKQTQIAYV